MTSSRFKVIKLNFHVILNLIYFLEIYHYNVKLNINYLDVETCPKCYGKDFCKELLFDTYVSNTNIWNFFSNVFSSKNILFCEYLNERIVLKKLGSNQDLSRLDMLPNLLDIPTSKTESITTGILNSLKLNVGDDDTENNFSLQMCPSVDKFNLVIDQIAKQRNIKMHNEEYNTFLFNIYTTLFINPEPIMLQMLDHREWPVAKHIGLCGRVSVQKYMGETMDKFYYSDWILRANITVQLLKAAKLFTFKHQHFRIYLTDISMDNIAVSNSGQVTYVDLEHMLLLDKNYEVSDDEWKTNHTSEVIKCSNQFCFAYSPIDICSHHLSDHNFYMTCEMLLNDSHNFLHNIPKKVSKRYSNIIQLLQNCVKPFNAKVRSRFIIIEELISVLQKSIKMLISANY